jgi:hypothetical protein
VEDIAPAAATVLDDCFALELDHAQTISAVLSAATNIDRM